MKAILTDYYLKVLGRLVNIEEATKQMTFNLLHIDDKEELVRLAKLTDTELIEALKN